MARPLPPVSRRSRSAAWAWAITLRGARQGISRGTSIRRHFCVVVGRRAACPGASAGTASGETAGRGAVQVFGVKGEARQEEGSYPLEGAIGATAYPRQGGQRPRLSTKPRFTVKKLKPKSRVKVRITAVNSAGSSPTVTVKIKPKR